MAESKEKVIKDLEARTLQIRKDVVKMIGCGTGHAGGSLSAAEVVTALYFHQMKHDPKNPQWEERDRFILSKGHCAPLLYAALAGTGYFDRDLLWTLRQFGSCLQGHPDMKYEKPIPGIEISTGELGQGLSVGAGIALSGRIKKKDFNVYVLLGDGEIQEGQVWEAAMFSAHYKIGNLTAVVDSNKLQIDGPVAEIMNVEPIAEKFKAFGWNTIEIDGHNVSEVVDAFEKAVTDQSKPTAIVSNTVKGKGVSAWENNRTCHHLHSIDEDEIEKYLDELNKLGC